MAPVGPRVQLLRAATQATHERLERRLRLFDAGLDRARYADYLAAFWSVVAPLERAFTKVAELERSWPDFHMRSKADLLRRDLGDLGSPAELEESRAIPAIDGASDALGAGYVLEGSTLGGAVIRSELARRLADLPARYLSCYGADLRRSWLSFIGFLERADVDEQRLAGSALATFAAVEAELERKGLLG